jgi:hypothetical protein
MSAFKTAAQFRQTTEPRMARYENVQPGTFFTIKPQLKHAPEDRCYYLKTRDGYLCGVHWNEVKDGQPNAIGFNGYDVVLCDAEIVIRNAPPQVKEGA